jgi:hypothetical protein
MQAEDRKQAAAERWTTHPDPSQLLKKIATQTEQGRTRPPKPPEKQEPRKKAAKTVWTEADDKNVRMTETIAGPEDWGVDEG